MDIFIKDDKLLFSKIGQLIGCDPRFNILGGFWGRHRAAHSGAEQKRLKLSVVIPKKSFFMMFS